MKWRSRWTGRGTREDEYYSQLLRRGRAGGPTYAESTRDFQARARAQVTL